jgi:hypothetical protein
MLHFILNLLIYWVLILDEVGFSLNTKSRSIVESTQPNTKGYGGLFLQG